MRPALALALLALLSGCAAVPPGPVIDPPLGPPLPAGYDLVCPPGPNLTLRPGVCAGLIESASESFLEPYVALHPERPDVVAIGFNAGQSVGLAASLVRVDVIVTEDAGRTWRRSTLPSFGLAPPTSAIDPALAFGPDGVLHATAMVRGASGGYQIAYALSADLGLSWTGSIVDASAGNDRSWVGVGPGGEAVLTWGKPGADGAAAWSMDGKEWTDVRLETPDATCEETGLPVTFNGSVLVPCTAFDAAGNVLEVRVVRLDLAASVTSVVADTHVSGEWPLLATVPGGGLVLVAETSSAVFVSSSPDGATWSDPWDVREAFSLEDAWTVLEYQWLAPDPWGRVHMILKGDAVCHRDTPGLIDCPDADTVYGGLDLGGRRVLDELLLDANVEATRPPPAAYRTNYEYDGLAWGPERGFAAWTTDGRIAYAWLEARS